MFVEEVFVEIPGYSNYAVSNYGSVVNVKTERDMTLEERDGKYLVSLYSNGVRRRFFVHRLVAQAFFVDFDSAVEVWHISSDLHDNCITNLHLEAPRRYRG